MAYFLLLNFRSDATRFAILPEITEEIPSACGIVMSTKPVKITFMEALVV